MTKTISLDENLSMRALIDLTSNGDEILIEENGKPLAKVSPVEKEQSKVSRRIAGLGRNTMKMSDDFDAELSDEFWGFDRKGI